MYFCEILMGTAAFCLFPLETVVSNRQGTKWILSAHSLNENFSEVHQSSRIAAGECARPLI